MLKKSSSFVLAALKASTVEGNETGGVYPFTKSNRIGERFTRSAVGISSPFACCSLVR